MTADQTSIAPTRRRERRRGARSLILPGIATLIGLAILVALGVWQIERLAWKQDLVARVERMVDADPVPLPDPATWAALDPADYDYRPVHFTGRFLHDLEAHYYVALGEPHGRYGGVGYFVLTPTELPDGTVVVVNRGFVPEAFKEPDTRAAGQVPGEVEIVGLMRRPERPAFFSPDPDIEHNVWLIRDPKAIAAARGLDVDRTAPFVVEMRATDVPGGLPQGGETTVEFPNNHLQYAFTWFGLGAALVAVFIAFARKRLREPEGPAPA